MAGDSKQGKTTLSVYLLQELGGTFVGDENLFLNMGGGEVKGYFA